MARTIRLIDAGDMVPARAHALSHALASSSSEDSMDSLVLSASKEPYVSIGLYQEANQDIDREACKRRNIPVFRRQLGGGAFLTGPGHQLFQTVFHWQRSAKSATRMFQEAMGAVAETYRQLGIDAHFMPVSSVFVRRARISRGAVGRLDDAVVLTGDFSFAHDNDLAHAVLGRSYDTSTSIEGKFEGDVDRDAVKSLFVSVIARVYDAEIARSTITDSEEKEISRFEESLQAPDWTDEVDQRVRDLVERANAQGQRIRIGKHATNDDITIRAQVTLTSGKVDNVVLTGDFHFYRDQLTELEQAFHNIAPTWDNLMTVAENFYLYHEVDSPGVYPEDWVSAIYNATSEGGSR